MSSAVVFTKYLECTLDSHFKFYQVDVLEIPGTKGIEFQVVTKWGKIGTAGRATEKARYKLKSSAIKCAEKSIGAKLVKGYKIKSETTVEGTVLRPDKSLARFVNLED